MLPQDLEYASREVFQSGSLVIQAAIADWKGHQLEAMSKLAELPNHPQRWQILTQYLRLRYNWKIALAEDRIRELGNHLIPFQSGLHYLNEKNVPEIIAILDSMLLTLRHNADIADTTALLKLSELRDEFVLFYEDCSDFFPSNPQLTIG